MLRAVAAGRLPAAPAGSTRRSTGRWRRSASRRWRRRPEDRYASSRALADDVERWAADEPVSAWREPWPRRAPAVGPAEPDGGRGAGRLGPGRPGRHRRRARGADPGQFRPPPGLQRPGRGQSPGRGRNADLRRANAALGEANRKVERSNGELSAANAELAEANRREVERFDLAMEAIRLFHNEVSQDLMLKEKALSGLRDRLLKGASGFYTRLTKALEAKPDPRSCAALATAYFDLAELAGQAGTNADAVASHRKALELRRELASGPNPDGRAAVNAARSAYNLGLSVQFASAPGAGLPYWREAAQRLEGLEAASRLADRDRQVLALATPGAVAV